MVSKTPWEQYNSGDWAVAQYWAGAYGTPPDAFLPRYSDGSWGYYPNVSQREQTHLLIWLWQVR